MVPYHYFETRLNSIGGHRWTEVGDWIAWHVDIPQDGYYKIAIKAKQNTNRGDLSNRKLLIDGAVPFAEVAAIPFPFSSRYEIVQLGEAEQGEPFLFYLTKGRHEIRLEAVLGELGPLIQFAEETLYELNAIYRSIIMITSPTPDPIRSYQLEQRVPQLLERIKAGEEDCAIWPARSNASPASAATLPRPDFARMLERMYENPMPSPTFCRSTGCHRSAGNLIMTPGASPPDRFSVVASLNSRCREPNLLVEVAPMKCVFAFVRDYTTIHTF